MCNDWNATTDFSSVCRKMIQEQRRWTQVAALALELGPYKHGTQAEIARRLGVSRSTICRDMQKILEATRRRVFGEDRFSTRG